MKPRIHLYYFTDPLCSHCWALDTTLTLFKHAYADYLNIITVMGGMLESGNHYDDLKGPLAKEQAKHWDQVGAFYRIPINGDIWMKDPITSSFPSSIAFLLIQQKDPVQAAKFMRLVREGAFVFEKNIAKKAVLQEMMAQLNIDSEEILETAFAPEGKQILIDNMQPLIDLSINGFPSVVMVNSHNEGIKVTGARTFDTYKNALNKIKGDFDALIEKPTPNLDTLLNIFPHVFFSEIQKIYHVEANQIEAYIRSELKNVPHRIESFKKIRYVQKSK
jgi:predicted DsbA family dithiol-disulfide isomerase